MEDYIRVSQKKKCPICGKPKWCSLTSDGKLAFCMRESAGSIKQARNGAYIHVLIDDISFRKQTTKTASPIRTHGNAESMRASINRRDEVYRAMLEMLTLSMEHAYQLLEKRRLSDTTIANNLYASVPSQWTAKNLCNELSSRFNLRGVPGFYQIDGQWRLSSTGSGFFVPCRTAEGLISALQVRRDDDSPRYLWLSSADKALGSSSGAPLHFVKPDLARRSNEILVTEGALKADSISDQTDLAAIAVAGVSVVAPDKLIFELRQNLPEVKRLRIAFDADWREKEHVRHQLIQLVEAVDAAGFDGDVMQWDALLGKGLDDVLVKGELNNEHSIRRWNSANAFQGISCSS